MSEVPTMASAETRIYGIEKESANMLSLGPNTPMRVDLGVGVRGKVALRMSS